MNRKLANFSLNEISLNPERPIRENIIPNTLYMEIFEWILCCFINKMSGHNWNKKQKKIPVRIFPLQFLTWCKKFERMWLHHNIPFKLSKYHTHTHTHLEPMC